MANTDECTATCAIQAPSPGGIVRSGSLHDLGSGHVTVSSRDATTNTPSTDSGSSVSDGVCSQSQPYDNSGSSVSDGDRNEGMTYLKRFTTRFTDARSDVLNLSLIHI